MNKDSRSIPARDYGIDNLRCLLIVCVVLGHLLEICTPFVGSESLYRVIYSFHMPAFVFLTGYFARYDPRKIFAEWVVPYALFQSLYLLFSNFVLDTPRQWQYTTPYWLLWYLLACIFYLLLIPLYNTGSPGWTLAAVFLLALAAGFDSTVGYYATLSRFLVFQPWFVLGHFARRYPLPQLRFRGKAACTAAVAAAIFWVCGSPITWNMLYGSYDYAAADYTVFVRLGLMAAALVWIVFFMQILKPLLSRKIPCLTALGQNTLPVYLLHGFVVRAIRKFRPELLDTPLGVFGVLAGILLLFGNPWVGNGFRRFFACLRKVLVTEPQSN